MKILRKNNEENLEKLVEEVAEYDRFMEEVTGGSEEELSEDDLTMVTAAGNSGMSYDRFAAKYLGKK